VPGTAPVERSSRTKEKATKAALDAQREKWRKQQQKYRATWGPQKLRRHREKARAYYHKKSSKSNYDYDEIHFFFFNERESSKINSKKCFDKILLTKRSIFWY
jgi:hypothetical protein